MWHFAKKKMLIDSYRKFIGFKAVLNMLTFKLNLEPKYTSVFILNIL